MERDNDLHHTAAGIYKVFLKANKFRHPSHVSQLLESHMLSMLE